MATDTGTWTWMICNEMMGMRVGAREEARRGARQTRCNKCENGEWREGQTMGEQGEWVGR